MLLRDESWLNQIITISLFIYSMSIVDQTLDTPSVGPATLQAMMEIAADVAREQERGEVPSNAITRDRNTKLSNASECHQFFEEFYQ